MSPVKVGTLACEKRACHSISSVVVSKAISLGAGSRLTLTDSAVGDSVDVTFEYNLAYPPNGVMLTCPDFTPKSIRVNYAVEHTLVLAQEYCENVQVLREFDSVSACESWKDKVVDFVDKTHTRNGEVFKARLDCASSSSRAQLVLEFELTGERINITIPPPLPGLLDVRPPTDTSASTIPETNPADAKLEEEMKAEPLIPYGYLATIILLLLVCAVWFTADITSFYFHQMIPDLDRAIDNAELAAESDSNDLEVEPKEDSALVTP